jgi:hypothetical protein
MKQATLLRQRCGQIGGAGIKNMETYQRNISTTFSISKRRRAAKSACK